MKVSRHISVYNFSLALVYVHNISIEAIVKTKHSLTGERSACNEDNRTVHDVLVSYTEICRALVCLALCVHYI